ncbi:MAG: TerC family protein [Thermoactinomyces sp.]|jgi:YjbE family integral membrane protein
MESWLTDTAFWIGFFNIIILDLLLSGDNAVVIGMAARNLPEHQRKKAVIFGAGMAVILRASLTAIAAYLLKIPLIMTVGGMLLLWIAVNLLAEEEEDTEIALGRTLKSAIKTIIVADVVMSLDNVLAVAGAAHGSIILVLFGLALSIPIIMWGSGLVAALLNRLPWLTYVGTAILGYTAGELIVEDPVISSYLLNGQDYLDTAIPVVLAVLVMIGGHALKKANNKQKMA